MLLGRPLPRADPVEGPPVIAIDFLRGIYPEVLRPGQLMVCSQIRRSGKTKTDWCFTLQQAARLTESYHRTREVLFGVALQHRDKALSRARRRYKRATPAQVRGGEASVGALPALWAEIGVRGAPGRQMGKASAGPLPPDRAAALGLLEAVLRPPSIVVWTGTAFQVYWVLEELWELATEDDIRRARRVSHKVRWALATAAAAEGWGLDHDGDLAGLMRMPTTFHHCGGKKGVLVTVEQFRLAGEAERRWPVADFEALEDPPPESGVGRSWEEAGAAAVMTAAEPAADFRPLWRGCSWLRHCYDDQSTLPEREWRVALSIVGRSAVPEDPDPGPAIAPPGGLGGRSAAGPARSAAAGRTLARRYSAGHPGYVPHLLDEELTKILGLKAGPATCKRIAEVGGWERHCSRCPSRGRIRSPIDLGRKGDAARAAAGESPGGRTPGSTDPADRERTRIDVANRESEVNAQALAALASGSSDVFERGGVLVEVDHPAGVGSPMSPGGRSARATRVQEARLQEILGDRCVFTQGEREVRPPRWCTRALLARGRWPELPSLTGVVEGPVLRADGSVVEEPGYDPATGVYYAASGRFEPVAERPGRGDVDGALALLRETVCDFPFQEEVHYAAWLAALLTPLARPAFEGPSPLSFVDANRRGAGKSLLVDVASVILTGRPASRVPHRRAEDEIQRSINQLALEGSRMVLYDNVTGVFGSAILALALTTSIWRDRLPGAGAPSELPLELSWWVTSNGVALDADLPRRTIRIRLESHEEHPEERTDFRHPRLLVWVRENRGRILPAALTLLRAYVAAGGPAQRLSGMGSFEGWSDLVRSAVVYHGLPDPGLARMTHPVRGASGLGVEGEVLAAFAGGLEELRGAHRSMMKP